jgi:Dolichyl-phosphate-mannose-protein mannosyltransferase
VSSSVPLAKAEGTTVTLAAAPVSRAAVEPRFGTCLLILAALTAIRLGGLWVSTVDLYFDESQYWAWSRDLAFGYFSKPPLLAWIIAAAEHACGSAEACLRSPAPLLYFATCALAFQIGKLLYDARTGFWAALLMATGTGLAFSARIITTDVPLLLFWTLALLAFLKLREEDSIIWSLVLGLALGLGLLAKYAMIYFVLSIAAAALVDSKSRALLPRPTLWLALAIGALLIAPNLYWNVQHGFITFRHTGHNIAGGGLDFSFLGAIEFLLSQFAVFGPVVFGTLLGVLIFGRRSICDADRMMLCFALPVLVLIACVAVVTRVNANWAGVAGLSATVLAAAVLVRRRQWGLIGLSIGIGLLAQVAFLIGDANAYRIRVPFLAKPDIYHRTLGWRGLGDEAGRIATKIGAKAIAAEDRNAVASLLYYQRDRGRPVLSWPHGSIPEDQFDISNRLTDKPDPVLFITSCPNAQRYVAHYGKVEPLGEFSVASGPTSVRHYFAFKLAVPRGPIKPLGSCA